VSEVVQQHSPEESSQCATDLLELVVAPNERLVAKLEAENQSLRSELLQWKTEAERLAQALERLKVQQQTPRETVDPD